MSDIDHPARRRPVLPALIDERARSAPLDGGASSRHLAPRATWSAPAGL